MEAAVRQAGVSMDDNEIIGTMLPPADFGDPDCCGCLNGITRGEQADLGCNECWAVVRTMAAAELERTIHEMELSLDVATARCPHCGAVHFAPGFSELYAFVCDGCGESVEVKRFV
jgi:hypothetical protein